MKLLAPTLVICITTSVTFFSFLGCKTSKKTSKKDISIIILLKDGQDGVYIQKKYTDYGLNDLIESNKTLNEYRVSFNLSEDKTGELLKLLEADPKIIKSTVDDGNHVNSSSGKGRKTARVKPKF